MWNFLRKLFAPSHVYVIINRIEYNDGVRIAQIVSIMKNKEEAQRFVGQLKIQISKVALAPNIKLMTFESNEYALE